MEQVAMPLHAEAVGTLAESFLQHILGKVCALAHNRRVMAVGSRMALQEPTDKEVLFHGAVGYEW